MSNWTTLQSSKQYQKGVEGYLDKALATWAIGDQISCPCKSCYHRFWHRRDKVFNHLIANGIQPGLEEFNFHEKDVSSTSNFKMNSKNTYDDIDRLIYDTHRDVVENLTNNHDQIKSEPNDEAKRFYRLIEDGKQELFPGCKTFSKLSFLIRFYLLKCKHGLTNNAFSDILNLLLELLPDAKLPKSFNEANKLVSDLGLHYEKIDACRNDCMLFWKDHANDTYCHVCQTPRWKEVENHGNQLTNNTHNVAEKIMWYFPLKPRLQRLYMCSEIAKLMKWHEEKRDKDELLRHPADAKAWLEFDCKYPNFGSESRNVRLGLASDGFNPFCTMSTQYSTWPVVLINYNLPPWLCMKPEFLMLSTIIPGPNSPGNNIDVFLQPLKEDLNDLWEFGLDTYDASKRQTFKMHAALLSTTSDFPGYAMLSGWSTKGKFACPHCYYETDHRSLCKSCYLGNRRFLDANHPWRQKEERNAPVRLKGTEILCLLENWENKFGKLQPKPNNKDNPWRKKSIFFYLPYWKDVMCRHHLDVMHIEKNICDSVLATVLDIPGKTKHHHKARLDLKKMGIRQELHPLESNDDRYVLLPKASFSMTKEEKQIFCSVIKKVKLPQGCGSNISRCVQLKEGKISGYKSHDAHIIMQHLLPATVRKALPKHVALPLIRLSAFFKAICNRVINPKELDRLQTEISETLCQLEKIFPPSFFDIMIHLPIHLVEEVRLGGPVCDWWMYPIERYLHHGAKEGFKSIDDDKANNVDDALSLFPKIGYPLGRKKKGKKKGKAYSLNSNTKLVAHRYALFNCQDEQVQYYIKKHENFVKSKSKDERKRRWREAKQHSNELTDWFKEKVELDNVRGHIKWLSLGPSNVARSYTGYFCNGYKFYTKNPDDKCKTQYSGVSLTALTRSFASSKDSNPILGNVTYYGVIKDIIEIDYWGAFSVVLFECDWYEVEIDDYGLTCVNFKKLCSTNDPFVLASQVHQVFYLEDGVEKDLHYVCRNLPRDFFYAEAQYEDNYMKEVLEPPEDEHLASINDDDVTLCRVGISDRVDDTACMKPMLVFKK